MNIALINLPLLAALIVWFMKPGLHRAKVLPVAGVLHLALVVVALSHSFHLNPDAWFRLDPLGGWILLVVSTLFVPASITALFTGFLLLTTRKRALLQVVGYLVLENGVYLFSLLLVKEMPLLVETGVLLDLVVGIFVMGIVINHIQTAFDSQDTHRLAHLKD